MTTDPTPASAPVRLDRQLVRLLAVEVLLTHPEELGNDALETDLYILRDQLRAAVQFPGHAAGSRRRKQISGITRPRRRSAGSAPRSAWPRPR
jgi:hypothetical protein